MRMSDQFVSLGPNGFIQRTQPADSTSEFRLIPSSSFRELLPKQVKEEMRENRQQVVSSVTASLRFQGALNVDLNEIQISKLCNIVTATYLNFFAKQQSDRPLFRTKFSGSRVKP